MDDRTIVVGVEIGGSLPGKKRLREYFESQEKSGGGVLDLLDLRDDGTALICFRQSDNAAAVESRDHELDGVPLIVYPFYGVQPGSETSDYDNTATLTRTTKRPTSEIPDNEDAALFNSATTPVTLETEEIQMSSSKARFFQNFPPKEVQSLLKQFEECDFTSDSIVIKGAPDTFREKANKLKLSFLNIKEETFDITKPLIYSLLTSKRGQKELEQIENELRCVFQIDQGYYSSREDSEESASKQETEVTLVTGDITDQEVDVLVSSVSPDLDLTAGSTSGAILRLGGEGLQEQCKDKYPRGIELKDLARITGGKLRCKEIFLCPLPEFKDDENLKTYGTVIYKCLYEACSSGHTSIAFSALGTGHNGYPPTSVARTMFHKILQFISYATSLRDIRIVVSPGNQGVIKAFEDEKPSFLNINDENDDSDGCDTESIVSRGDFRVGNMRVHFKQGEISMETSQAVVNLVGTATALSGGSSSSDLLSACGKEIDSQCQLAVKTLQKKGAAVTTAPRIPAEYIIHIAVDHYKGSLKDIIKACLKAASEHHFTSLALPCLWTEMDGMALKNIAKLFVKCLEDFEKKSSSLKDVSVVIEDETYCTLFLSLMEDVIQKKARKARSRFSYRRRDNTKNEVGGENQKSVEEVYVKKGRDSDAEVTICSETQEVLKKAFSEVEQLYKSLFVARTLELKNLKHLSSQKITSLKRTLEEINVCASITWSTGVVDVEGLDEDVQKLETLLKQVI